MFTTHIMNDGSRFFLGLPESQDWHTVYNHILTLSGGRRTKFLYSVNEAWMDFEYDSHQFTINTQFGEYWFFVADPTCNDRILYDVASHFESLLRK